MWPPDGRRNEGTAEEHAIVLFDSLPVQAFFSWLGSFTAQPRRDTHGHQNVPSARFSRCAHSHSSLGLRNAKKETPSKRMVFLFWSGQRENRRSAACGRISEVVLRKCPNGRCRTGRELADTTRAGAPKRCLWQNKRGGFKEVSQWPVPERDRALADTTRAQLRRMQSFSFDAPSAKFTATWLGSLTAHSAVTRTRAPKRATGTFFSLCSCPVRASADAIPKKKHHPAG